MAGSPLIWAEPFIPKDDNIVLEQLPSLPMDSWTREIKQLRIELERDPKDPGVAVRLAGRYISKGRAEADPRYYGYAQAALSPWWEMPDPPIQILVLRATIRQSSHNFEDALADLSKVLEVDPGNLQAWLTQAIILQVQGKYDKAHGSCKPISDASKRTSSLKLLANICSSSVLSFNGGAVQSYKVLRNTLDLAPLAPFEEKLWALTVLADIAVRTGRTQTAEEHFKQALDLGLRDSFLLGAYADFLLDRDRASEVIDLLKNETRADGLLLRLALAERAIGDPTLSEHIQALRSRFEASRLRADRRHLREEARFTLELLNQPEEALRLAQANWSVQREPEDVRILLESAIAANDGAGILSALDWQVQTGLEDVQLSLLAQPLRHSP